MGYDIPEDHHGATPDSGGTVLRGTFPQGRVCGDAFSELLRAEKEFPGFNSAHEGHSVLREELEELWDHVKADTGYSELAYKEAIQVAAMGMRYALMVLKRQAEERAHTKGTL